MALCTTPAANYDALSEPGAAPELPSGKIETAAQSAVRNLLRIWGLDESRHGLPTWNPLGCLIEPGDIVALKPNWVSHKNRSGGGLECLITHPSVIEAVLQYVALAKPYRVVIGDSPVQGCDFDALKHKCGLDDLVVRARRTGLDVQLADFRRTIMPGPVGRPKIRNARPDADYILFDLKRDSCLEPISVGGEFRVCLYDPDDLTRAHQPGRHQYLIAREAIEADVLVNIPKLKCHQKTCLTAGIKNFVGANGAKEYLPHHRLGGSQSGGDCYHGASVWKRGSERLLDVSNRLQRGPFAMLAALSAEIALRIGMKFGADGNLDGEWYGNDTVWRTTLDLQRILRYGTLQGSLADSPQRRVITIVDAIIGGQGEGPLSPRPAPSRCLTGALNDAAGDWVNARLMGFDPAKLAITREAFGRFRWPLTDFQPDDIRVLTDAGECRANEVFPPAGVWFTPPRGWAGYCELDRTLTADAEAGAQAPSMTALRQ